MYVVWVCVYTYNYVHVCICVLHYILIIFISSQELGYTLAPGDTPASVAYQQVRNHNDNSKTYTNSLILSNSAVIKM